MNVGPRRTKLTSWVALLLAALALLSHQRTARALIGGDAPGFFEHPWLAQISVGGGHECGGALIAPTWVLTAAHCVHDDDEEDVIVTLGNYDLSWEDDWGEQVHSVAEIVKHPYEIDYNDIVLLRLSTPAAYTVAVQPIALADGDYAPGTTTTIAGWGATQYLGPPSNQLLEDSFPLVSNEVCAPVVGGGGTLEAKMLCAGVPSGPATCKGDSGGPMVVDGANGKEVVGLVSWGRESCQPYTVGVRVRDYKPWIEEKVFGARPPVCSGRTAPGDTRWQNSASGVIFSDVDTTPCGWGSTPQYFTSLGGNGGHYNIDGVSSIYNATAKGFRVYLYKSGLTAASANSNDYHINWQSVALNTNVSGLCSGRSPSNTWQVHQTDAIYIDVNTTACGLSSTPSYFTSLTGLNTSHGQARGTTAIYTPTSSGFRVYLHRTGITPATAQFLDWRIQWRAEQTTVNLSDVCNGKTSTASTSWIQDGANRVYTNVNTSACSIPTTPKFFTSLGGTGSHYSARTITSVYSPTPDSFRVYLESSGITPALANQRNWHVRWNALP